MKKIIFLALIATSVAWSVSSGWAATSFEVQVASDGNVSVTTSQGAAATITFPDGASTTEIASQSTFSSETGTVTPVDPSNLFAGGSPTDARSEDGKVIAAASAQPSSGGPGDVATAAGSEEGGLGATDTAAGGGAPADTQSPLPPVTSNPNPPPTTSV